MNVIKKLKSLYNKQQFQPSLLGIFLNPFYFSRKAIFENMQKYAHFFIKNQIDIKTLLDVGCGQKPYRNLFNFCNYIGLELDTPVNRLSKQADFYYNGITFPFGDNSFECVISNQVIEHVKDSGIFLKEISRVLKKDGYLILSVPFIWDEHEIPNDYRRYSSFGIRQELEKYNFSILKIQKCNDNFSSIFQLINAYLYNIIPQKKYIRLLSTFTIFAFVNICGKISQYIVPHNKNFFLDLVILAKKED